MNTIYRCNTCQKAFVTIEELFFHLLVIEKENPFKVLTFSYLLSNLLIYQICWVIIKSIFACLKAVFMSAVGIIFIVTKPFVWINDYLHKKIFESNDNVTKKVARVKKK